MRLSFPITLVAAFTFLTAMSAFSTSGYSQAETTPEVEDIDPQKQFIEDYAKQDGVIKRPSGLLIKVLKAGRGPVPVETDVVRAHYTGKLIDGTVFDSSVERNVPFEFPVGKVIVGWQEAMQLMQIGSKWELVIPSDLGYGERGAGQTIPPNATLVFEVELLGIL